MLNWSLVIFIGLGFFLRAVALFNDIDYDEAYTFLTYASKPVLVAIGMYNLPNNHLLNSLLIWIVNRLGGAEPWWIRLPQFLAWAVMAYQLFCFLQKRFSKELALMVVAALACTYQFVHYGSLARGYCLHTLLVLNCWFLLEAEIKNELEQRWVLPLMMALSFWVLPTTVYAMAAFFVYWISQKPKEIKSIFRTGSYGALITICLYTPAIFYVILNGTKSAREDGVITSVGSLLIYLWKMALYFVESPFALPAAVFAALFLIFPVLFWKKDHAMAKLWLCIVFVPWAVVVATKTVPPFNRVWLWLAPFFFIFAYRSLEEIVDLLNLKKWTASLAALFLISGSLYLSAQSVRSNWMNRKSGPAYATELLRKVVAPGDYVAFYQGYLTNLDYWEYIRPESSLKMKRYPVAGNWKFSLERLHAEPGILRKDLGQLSSVTVWSYLNSDNSNPDLEALVKNELPGWGLSLADHTVIVGNSKFAAFLLKKNQ